MFRQVSKSISSLTWPWPLTLWSQGRSFHAFAPWTTCANLHQNRFIRFQNIMFTVLIREERTDVGTNERTLPCACQSGLVRHNIFYEKVIWNWEEAKEPWKWYFLMIMDTGKKVSVNKKSANEMNLGVLIADLYLASTLVLYGMWQRHTRW